MNLQFRLRNAAFAAAGILFAATIGLGCSSSAGTDPNSNNNNNNNNPNGGTPTKTVSIAVHDEVAQPNGVRIFISVEIDSNDAAISLAASDSLYCNGINLALDQASNTYKGAITQQPQGSRYTFDILTSGLQHFLGDILVTARPVITYPQQGASVTRTKNFAITYQAVAGTVGIESTVRGLPVTLTSPTPETDNGTSSTYDVTSIPVGSGWVQIIRHYQYSHVDLGFKSIDANYYTGKVVGVNWQ